MSILVQVVGNLIKDQYINLNPTNFSHELDHQLSPHLDLNFNSTTYNYASNTSFFSGSAIIAEILSEFNHKPLIFNAKIKNDKTILPDSLDLPQRFIFTLDGHYTQFEPKLKPHTIWQSPSILPNWIFIDFSAKLNLEDINAIQSFLTLSKNTMLAVCLDEQSSPELIKLSSLANLIFKYTNQIDSTHNSSDDKTFIFNDHTIFFNDITIDYSHKLNKSRPVAKIYANNILSGTIFSSLISGASPNTAINYSITHLANTVIGRSLSLKELDDLITKEQNKADIILVAKTLMQKNKGILAADESGGSIHKKFANLNIPDNVNTRRDYRNIFLSTKNLEKYINGVILFEETAQQLSDSGRNFTELMIAKGIIPGIKVDQGLANIPNTEEKYTKGLDGLSERLESYYLAGLRFAKWRSAFEVKLDEQGNIITPSDSAIAKNCEILAKYALKCQQAHIVPIVEPELIHDGDYSIEVCSFVTEKILAKLFTELKKLDVNLAGCVLKTNMILAGKQHQIQSTPDQVGIQTITTLSKVIPDELAGVVFLSGGQSVEQATVNLAEIIKHNNTNIKMTFSFARALQDPALYAWQGNNNNFSIAQKAFLERLIKNTEALNP